MAGGAQGVAGEQASEVDYFQFVAQVLGVGLEAQRAFFVVVEIGACREILREVGADAVATKIQVIDHRLTVFRGVLLRSQIRLKRQSGVVIAAHGDPQVRGELIADAGANGLPLVLGIGKMSG